MDLVLLRDDRYNTYNTSQKRPEPRCRINICKRHLSSDLSISQPFCLPGKSNFSWDFRCYLGKIISILKSKDQNGIRYQYHRSPPFTRFDDYHRNSDRRNIRFLTIFGKDYQRQDRFCDTKKRSLVRNAKLLDWISKCTTICNG